MRINRCAAAFALALWMGCAGIARAEDAPAEPAAPDAPAAEPAPPAPAAPAAPAAEAPKPDDAPPAQPAAAPEEAPAPPPKEEPKEEPKKEEAPPKEDAKAEQAAEAKKAEAAVVVPPSLPVCRPPSPYCLRGSVSVRARVRFADEEGYDSEIDADLYEYASLRFRNEDDFGWSGSFHGRLAQDLDGDVDNQGYYVFDSIDDTWGRAVTGRLYHAWAGYRFGGTAVDRVKAGRFEVEAGETFLVDGVRAQSAPIGSADLVFYAYGGLPAHLYAETIDGDWIFGAGLEATPWSCGNLRIDYACIDDDTRYYGDETASLVSVQVRHRFSESVVGRARYQHVNEDPYLVAGYLDVFWPTKDASMRASLLTQPVEVNQQVYELDPYYVIALDLQPYWEAHLAFSKGLGCHVTVDAGGDARMLYDGDDEDDFNREWQRVFATLSTSKWPARTVGLSLTGEWWFVADDQDMGAVTFDVDWRPSDCWRVAVGTDYSYYRVDLYAQEERVDNYGVFLRVQNRVNDRWRWDLSVRLDDSDDGTYGTVRAGVRWDF